MFSVLCFFPTKILLTFVRQQEPSINLHKISYLIIKLTLTLRFHTCLRLPSVHCHLMFFLNILTVCQCLSAACVGLIHSVCGGQCFALQTFSTQRAVSPVVVVDLPHRHSSLINNWLPVKPAHINIQQRAVIHLCLVFQFPV